jgi:hypothetical protein
MKKCPKCGTILDDSKKQCYMCGTNLDVVKVDLAENNQIGAFVSGGQDNVFNNGEDIKFKGKDVVKKNDDNAYFSHDSRSRGFFNEDLNSLNAPEPDRRSKFKKGLDSIFGGKKGKSDEEAKNKKKEKKEVEKPKKEESVIEKKGPQARNKRVISEEVPNTPLEQPDSDQALISKIMSNNEEEKSKNVISQLDPPKEKKEELDKEEKTEKKRSFGFLNEIPEDDGHDFGFTKEPKEKPKEKVKSNKPSIVDSFKKKVSEVAEKIPKKEKSTTRGYKDGGQDLKFNGQMFFNLIAIIAFIGVLYFVWNFVINKKADTSLSGLVYDMNSDFKLKSKDAYSRYYVYNDSCTIKINTSNNTSVDNYIQNIKDTYGNDPDAMVMFEELKINGKMWSSLGIFYYKKDGNEIGGKAPLAKYRYTSILNKGDFFAIIFVNTYEDSDCQDKYDDFIKTLNFKEG